MGCLGEERICLLVAGRLTPLARRLALRHLRTCASCAVRLEDARRLLLTGLLPVAAAEGLGPPGPEALADRIRAAVLADRRRRGPVADRPAVPRLAALAAAAAVLIAVLGYWFLGEARWKVRLLETEGAVYCAAGGEDPLLPAGREADLAAGSMVLVLPGGRAVASVEGVGEFEFTGTAVAVLGGGDGPPIHLHHGIARVRAKPGSPPALAAGGLRLAVHGEAEILVVTPSPAERLLSARHMAAEVAAAGGPALVPGVRAADFRSAGTYVHVLSGEVVPGPGLPAVREGHAVTFPSAGRRSASLSVGPLPLYAESELSPREMQALAALLALDPSPLLALARAAADPALPPWRRALAVWAAGTIGDPAAIPGLSALLADAEMPSVLRGAAVRSLFALGDRETTRRSLSDPDPVVAESAVLALQGDLRPGDLPAVAALAADETRPPFLRALAALAAGDFPEDVPTILLVGLAASPDSDAAALAGEALARRDDPESLAALRSLLAGGLPDLAAFAARALAARGRDDAVPALLAAAAPGRPEPLRSAAIHALNALRPGSAEVEAVLESALAEGAGPAFLAAAFALPGLSATGEPGPVSPLADRYLRPLFDRSDVPEDVLTVALIRYVPPDETLRRILFAARRPALRANALRWLARRQSPLLAVADILPLLDADDAYLRLAAAEALAATDPDAAFRVLAEAPAAPGGLSLADRMDVLVAAAGRPDGRASIGERTTAWLEGLLRGPDADGATRARALAALPWLGAGNGSARALAVEALRTGDAPLRLRAEAIRLLAASDAPSAPEVAAVRDALRNAREPDLARLLFPLIEAPPRPLCLAIPEAREAALCSPDAALRARAALLSAALPDGEAPAVARLADGNAVVRLAAVSGLLARGRPVDPRLEAEAWARASSVGPRPADDPAGRSAAERAAVYRDLVLSVSSAPESSPADLLAEVRVLAAEDRQFLRASALRRFAATAIGSERVTALVDLGRSGARADLDLLLAAAGGVDDVSARAALASAKRLLAGEGLPLFSTSDVGQLRTWWEARAYSWRAPAPAGEVE